MVDDLDVMRKTFDDCVMLFKEHYAKGWNTSEPVRAAMVTAMYTERMKLIKEGKTGDWLTDSIVGDKSLDNAFNDTLKKMAEEKAYALLEKELGPTAFKEYQTIGGVIFEAKNSHTYTIKKNGELIVKWDEPTRFRSNIKFLSGRISPEPYNMTDAMITLVKWLKSDPDVVDKTIKEHCGTIYMTGGEIQQ